MARLIKEVLQDTIVFALNEYLMSISNKEYIDCEFHLIDDGVTNEVKFFCRK